MKFGADKARYVRRGLLDKLCERNNSAQRRFAKIELRHVREIRDQKPATPTGLQTHLVTAYGNGNGFGNRFRKWCDEAKLLPECHELRKAGATFAAENGATEHQLMGLFGRDSPKQAAPYARTANRRRLTADAVQLSQAPS